MERKRYRRLLGLLVAIVVRSIAIAMLGWQVIDRQAEDGRKAIAVALGNELRDQLRVVMPRSRVSRLMGCSTSN